jgi:hypothetical protein
MTFDNYKFHPSSLGLIMTESRTKDKFGETCKAHLMECYVAQTYGRYKDVTNKYIEKGIVAEEDSIDLYSVVKKHVFVKNTEVISNDHFVGTPDLYLGESIHKADTVIDLKTSWDIFTFFGTMAKALDKRYFWQLQAYMDLTGAKQAKLVYCLVNTPFKLIEDQKKNLMWTMAVIDPDADEAYQKACEQVEKNSVYDDIPMEKRYIEETIERDQDAIDKAHTRVEDCREFLNQL